MRNRFDEQLTLLKDELIQMGTLCKDAIQSAVEALLEDRVGMAERAVIIDQSIDQKERDIESLCLKLLLHQQPVAKDLRQISAALKMITDMERIGDQAADIAEIIMLDHVQTSGKLCIAQMAEATSKMVTDSVNAYVEGDLELAHKVMADDDVVDNLFNEMKKGLAGMLVEDSQDGEHAIDMLMIAKYFERIGDHATNIAEWVEFSITGKHEDDENKK